MPTLAPSVLVLCDFDGTITTNDLTNVVWDHFLPYDWRARLLPDSERGLISATELMRRGYADVRQSEEEILALLRDRVEVRAGFDDLLAHCRNRGWPFIIVSNGLRFYIEAALGRDVTIWAHEAHFDGRWIVDVPPSVVLEDDEDFKSHVVRNLREAHASADTVYIGDGRLDFEPAKLCDHVFCVRGSALESRCRSAGIAAHAFTEFAELTAALLHVVPAVP